MQRLKYSTNGWGHGITRLDMLLYWVGWVLLKVNGMKDQHIRIGVMSYQIAQLIKQRDCVITSSINSK